MSYAIVYSSHTGNTALLAQALRQALPESDCIYFGTPAPEALAADTLYVGFWTDKGNCDQESGQFLSTLTHQKVFLFGTAGFGGAPAYFQQILGRVQEKIGAQVQVIGTYMCQGKMPQGVRTRYEAMEDSPRRTAMLENFDRALSHPDPRDLELLRAAVQQ